MASFPRLLAEERLGRPVLLLIKVIRIPSAMRGYPSTAEVNSAFKVQAP